MSYFYELIGRLVVAMVVKRFGRQLRVAGALVAVGALAAAYLLASREVEEG